MQYDIIIPHYGIGHAVALAGRCLETIREYSEDYRIIFVDNASPEDGQLRDELDRHPHILIRNTENLGFVKAVNYGLWLSTAPYVVLLNNDTEAVQGWLEALRDGFIRPNIGIVGPLMNVRKRKSDPIFKVSRPCWQSEWKISGGGGPYVLPKSAMVAFFCAMFRRETLDRVGYLDERYGVGFADDDDYCHRAHQAGYDIVLQQALAIPHHHRSTFAELYKPAEIKAMQDQAREEFRKKCKSRLSPPQAEGPKPSPSVNGG